MVSKMKKVPEKSTILDEGYRDIASRHYREADLKELGFEMMSSGCMYLEPKTSNGVALVFEKQRSGWWGINEANRKKIFNEQGINPVEYLDMIIDSESVRPVVDEGLLISLRTLRDYI